MGGLRLFHVRWHQWGRGAVRRALRIDHQPQFPRSARSGGTHAFDVTSDGRRRSGQRTSCRRPSNAKEAQGISVDAWKSSFSSQPEPAHCCWLTSTLTRFCQRDISNGHVRKVSALCCSRICVSAVMETNEQTSRSTNPFGKGPVFCWRDAISVAVRHVRRSEERRVGKECR